MATSDTCGNAHENSFWITMNRRAKLCFIALLLLPYSISLAQDSESSVGALRLHINGIGLHLDKGENTNEANWGLGIERSLGIIEREKSWFTGWKSFWEVDVYQDSYSDIALSAGFAVQRPVLRYLDFGLKFGFVFERGLEKNSNTPILPYLLPFVETSFSTSLTLRAIVVPPLEMLDLGGVVSLQLIYDIP